MEQLERYKLLIDSVQDYAIFLLDPSGFVASWNAGAEKLKGYKSHEIIGKHFSIFYTQADKDSGKAERMLKLARERGRIEDEDWRVRKDGTKFWADVVLTALYSEKGELQGFAKVTRDLTLRKRYEDDLERANLRLKRQRLELKILNTAKDEFVSLASHQLRTPATGVKQYLGMLLEGFAGRLSEHQADLVSKAYESNERQIDIVNDLLRVAQVDAGKIVLQKKTLDIVDLVEGIIDEQAEEFKHRRQKVTIHKPRQKMLVAADPERLRMVLENLVDNASKYTHDGGTITLSLDSDPRHTYIAIKDTGVGIKREDMLHLFQKFSRIPNERSQNINGSGLGLYWAHKIVQLHQGSINVASEPGVGTEFVVTLPKVRR